MSIQDYSKKIQHFLAQLNVFYRINKSKEMYLNTEKTSKNPRNSAYLYRIGRYTPIGSKSECWHEKIKKNEIEIETRMSIQWIKSLIQ